MIWGWLGSLCFAFSAAPQALKSYKEGHASGVSWGLIILSLIGEISSLLYVAPAHMYPLMLNYSCNLVFCSIILYYKMFPKE